ncbi:hypothetical protein Q5424_12040 [Conexibacter sp. JD483]|uniref:metallophosphoesterase n=1 Tax=unclassified Conexibacter TaxID=2627773 RepID=UPI0027202047|nr:MULTISPECIES: metallophosphoesterase [unclassified Conexibacter]MDO8188050.1 hypothetical protein [Conexibacter sp. CPCC 205706]MDO8200472.1 hypothetical protein [Conexibacter sp. CPCC 205762]MDR9369819.1 hypothetical protein [Conexibacter sp. JD483]
MSDLHLGAADGRDLLRQEALFEPLRAALARERIERVVLLGDAIELRQGPLRDAFAVARPFFERLGAALGGDGEVVLVPGNHDHQLVAPWLERLRRDTAPPPLGLEQRASWEPGDAVAALADRLAPARLTLAYPGIWLRDDVYALHGHYLDRHTTVPTFERLSAGAMGRIVGRPSLRDATPDDYEAALAPIYAWSYSLAQQSRRGGGTPRGTQGVSVRVWDAIAGDGHKPLRRRALGALFPLGVAAVNRAGLGPVRADVSGPALGVAGTRAMGAAVEALGIEARHVLFGHTHRSGPLPGDDLAVWHAAGGIALHNTGTWVFERHFLTRTPGESPYWPGRAIVVGAEPGTPPRRLDLLGDRSWDELSA